MHLLPLLLPAVAALAFASCQRSAPAPPTDDERALDPLAADYVRLVLAVGRHDGSFVDAYYGPPALREEAERGDPRPVTELLTGARELLARARATAAGPRRRFLEKQLVAVEAFLRRLSGGKLSFAEESRLLFDVAPPDCGPDVLEPARERLERLLPGSGDLASRMQAVRARVEVPRDRLPAVVDAVLAETRRRTAALVALPAGEKFEVAYVTEKPWGAYNWYKGGFQSLIEVNTDIPATLEGVLGTLSHEGYPGHHLYNALLEDRLVKGRGWSELTVYPLYSPQSLIAEGTANVGPEVVMSRAERRAFLHDVLAPIAGLDRADLDRWEELKDASKALGCAGSEAARRLLDEGRPEAEIEAFLVGYGTAPERARQNIRFYRAYRSYIVTYTVGEDLVERFIGEGPDRVPRYFDLLQRPVVPSELTATRATRE